MLQIKSFVIDASCITYRAHSSRGTCQRSIDHILCRLTKQDIRTAQPHTCMCLHRFTNFSASVYQNVGPIPPLYTNTKLVPSSSTIDIKKRNLNISLLYPMLCLSYSPRLSSAASSFSLSLSHLHAISISLPCRRRPPRFPPGTAAMGLPRRGGCAAWCSTWMGP